MRTFSVKNFDHFQHYKDRAPPWIKLYNALLDDYDFACLRDASKLHLIAIWLVASRTNNKIPYDAEWLSGRINATDPIDLDGLLSAGFIQLNEVLPSVEQDASKPLAECLSRERGETETEKKDSIPNGMAAGAFDEQTFERAFWKTGKEALGKLGIPSGKAGALLGKWKSAGRDVVIQAINRAMDRSCDADGLISYVEASLGGKRLNGTRAALLERKPKAPRAGTPEYDAMYRDAGG